MLGVQKVLDFLKRNRSKVATSAKVIEATECIETGARLVTFELFFPRCILAEQNTHRKKSRNTGSSRAIPILRMLKTLMAIPFIPLFWGANKAGMQSGDELSKFRAVLARIVWRFHAWVTYLCVFLLAKIGLHKQWTNRLLEPHTYVRQVMTSDDWSNYLALRLHDDAQPEIILLALLIKEQLDLLDKTNGYRKISNQERVKTAKNMHLPYVTTEERVKYNYCGLLLAKISASRCARTSYLTQEGMVPDLNRELRTFKKLAESEPIHASPLEHQAWAAQHADVHSRNFKGFIQYRAYFEENEFGKPIELPTNTC